MLIQMSVLLLLLFCCVCNVCCSTVPDNTTDVLPLLQFKRAATDPQGALSNWNTSTHFCQWKGITCNLKNRGRVTELNLVGQGLSGTIVDSIGNLTALHILNLSNNQFSGQIPPLNNIRSLEVLDLNTNSLEGNIPDTLTNCSSLRILWLYSNTLAGTIPPNIGHLSNLVNFDLSGNNLTGIIPPAIGNISRLNLLNLGINQLMGSIPDEIGKLSNMSVLELNDNILSGGIPPILFNLSSLQALDLGSNTLGKTLPSNMGDRLFSLQSLYLNGNEIEGQIPSSIGSASELQAIWISLNRFSGPVPTSLGNLSKLSELNLEQNALETWNNQSWEFLNALRNCSLLNLLSLGYNNLQGVLPDSIGNLSPSLQVLRMGFNNISGIIPPSIGKLQNLTTLRLSHNSFTGPIGEWLGNLENLQDINLEDNNFTGPIPSSVGNLKQLLSLYLAKNEFEGSIPANLGNLQQLAELDVSYNKLQGSIPDLALTSSVRMRKCVLSYNNLEGSIPLDFSKLQELTELHLSSNAFTGYIPDSIGQCQMLEIIEMDKNFLTGNIPVSFSKLNSLSTLNVSHNNLSGTIPLILTELQYLTHLDISYNHFNGEVPKNGVFANATAVSLEGNWGLCGGATTLHIPLCPTKSKRVEIQYYLIKVLIPVFGFMSLLLLIYFLLTEKTTRRRQHLPFPSFEKQFPKVTYQDLAQATKDFSESNLIGRGSYASVYRCKLKKYGMEMAVKVFDLEMPGAERSFLSECEALRSIQHRNLLPIKTACSTADNRGSIFKALLYEFMPNGSLDTWLHSKAGGKSPKRLGFSQRINIIVNIADVLDYLHHECGRPTVHCDLKPSNILLDDDLNALLGDFGIARFYADSKSTPLDPTNSVGVRGTIGYIAPEYAGGGRQASTSGDVYSFGIVVLEMMTGKRPTDPIFKDGLDIVNFVSSNFPLQISQVVDPHIIEECKEFSQDKMESENAIYQCLLGLLQIALSCTHPSPNERVNIKEVANKLHAIQMAYVGGKAKK